jgi:hypothetical protein
MVEGAFIHAERCARPYPAPEKRGRGRPPLLPADRKSVRVVAWLTETEAEALDSEAARLGVDRSTLIRLVVARATSTGSTSK